MHVGKVKLSVITVTYNDDIRFLKTYKNIVEEIINSIHVNEVEYLIKEGDPNKRLDSNTLNANIRYIAKKDEGIYSAMNQAVELAKGDYVIFINSGDFLVKGALDKIFKHLGKANILGFNFKKGDVFREQKKFNKFLVHRSPCHQGIVSKKEITRFSELYKLSSDYKFLLDNKKEILWVDDVISVFGNEIKDKKYQNKINDEKIDILCKSKINSFQKIFSIIKLKF